MSSHSRPRLKRSHKVRKNSHLFALGKLAVGVDKANDFPFSLASARENCDFFPSFSHLSWEFCRACLARDCVHRQFARLSCLFRAADASKRERRRGRRAYPALRLSLHGLRQPLEREATQLADLSLEGRPRSADFVARGLPRVPRTSRTTQSRCRIEKAWRAASVAHAQSNEFSLRRPKTGWCSPPSSQVE